MYPPPPAPPARRGPVIALAAIGVLLGLVGALLFVTQVVAPPPADPAPSRPAAATSSSPRAVPTPDAAERRTYLAAIRRIHPRLAADEERAMRRAQRVCERIVRPPGGTMTLERYVVLEMSGGTLVLGDGQARQVIRAVRVWCR